MVGVILMDIHSAIGRRFDQFANAKVRIFFVCSLPIYNVSLFLRICSLENGCPSPDSSGNPYEPVFGS
jgi:hypothetical protein